MASTTLIRLFFALFAVYALAGCATTGTNGVVEIGDGVYMIGGLGGSAEHSGSAVKARFFQAAKAFCDGKQSRMIPLNSTGRDATGFDYASAEVQFRCKSNAQ